MAGSILKHGLRPMVPRDPGEHRAASPLELFFDLVFVVAVSFSSQQLHHEESAGAVGATVLAYLMVFFSIWWAWMNFTWFATAFDTDDWLYRVTTIVQMGGVLLLAAGTGSAMAEGDFALVTYGYVIMRLAMVSQWLRAARHAPSHPTALRYAAGITVVQIAWLVRLALPEQTGIATFLILVVAELAVPVWAERHGTTAWNAHHIAERYSLLTLILLGESILASANAIAEAFQGDEAGGAGAASAGHIWGLVDISIAGLLVAAGMWWVYFAREQHQHITSLSSSLRFGYFHYVIFAAAGAYSAGVEVAVDSVLGHTTLGTVTATATFTIPVAAFLLGIWWLTIRRTLTAGTNTLYLLGVLVVLAGTLLGARSMDTSVVGVVLAVVACELPDRRAAGVGGGGIPLRP